MAKCVMVMSTSSHVGKRVIATVLCRIFRQDGYRGRSSRFKTCREILPSSGKDGTYAVPRRLGLKRPGSRRVRI